MLVAREFCRKLTELFGTLLLTLCFLLFGFAPLRFFFETLAQYFGGPGTMRLTDFFRRIAVEMMPEVRVCHPLLVTGRVGVQAQGNPEHLSVQLWARRQNLFVYADRQRQVIAKDRELLAKLLEQVTCCESRIDGGRRQRILIMHGLRCVYDVDGAEHIIERTRCPARAEQISFCLYRLV